MERIQESDLKTTQQSLDNANKIRELNFYRFVIDSLPMAVMALDSSMKITEFSPWAEKITGYSSKEAIGHYCGGILQGGMCGIDCPLKGVLERQKAFVQIRTTIRNKEGNSIPVRMSTAGLFDGDGKVIGAVEAFEDISHLVAMERERANLFSMLAHDMRSSLSGIHGLGLRLLRKPVEMDEEKKLKHLEIITREAGKLEALVDDFLEFCRMETGRLKLTFTGTSLDKELEELFENYKVRAAQHNVKLELRIAEILPLIEADTNRLRRVFTNLLDNALKFSNAGGRVAITAEEKDREVAVKIEDEGIGIDPEDLPYIFDIFHRGRAAGKREGSGLGLATAKAIVEGHGGRIMVASQLYKGSTFAVFLPKTNEPDGSPSEEDHEYSGA